MLVKYNNKYYHTGFPKSVMDIWSFEAEAGFTSKTKKNLFAANKEITTYHKEVPITEVSEIFALVAFVKWNGIVVTASWADENHIDILLPEKEKEYALANMFEANQDFKAWQKTVPVSECSNFKMTKMLVYPQNEDVEISMSADDWMKYSKMIVTEENKGA